MLADYSNGADLVAFLTLPFGLIAGINTRSNVNTQPPIARPDLLAIEPVFADRVGGKQLSIQGRYDVANDWTVLPGSSRPTPITSSACSATMPPTSSSRRCERRLWGRTDCRNRCDPLRAVSRYDLSGYGTSLFRISSITAMKPGTLKPASTYRGPRGVRAGASQERHSAVAHRSRKHNDHLARSQRLRRSRKHRVARKTDGLFQYAGVPAGEIELGGMTGVYNVRNIVEGVEEIVAGKHYVRVTFDADIQLVVDPLQHGLMVTGGSVTRRIPSRSVTGYLIADTKDIPTVAEAVLVMTTLGTVGAPIAAEVDVSATAVKLGLTGVGSHAHAGPMSCIRRKTRKRSLLPCVAFRGCRAMDPGRLERVRPVTRRRKRFHRRRRCR